MKYRLEATLVTADANAAMVVPHSLDLTCKTTTLQATAQSLAVSVLDLVATRAGEPPGSAIARFLELARHVEQLGYKRYWVAEHHAIQGLACSATPVLIGHIAAATKTRGATILRDLFIQSSILAVAISGCDLGHQNRSRDLVNQSGFAKRDIGRETPSLID